MRREYLLFVIPILLFVFLGHADAEVLSFRRDLISVSEPASGSNHTITFTTLTTIPVSGKIVITPEAGAFTIPGVMDFEDADLLVGAVQQTLAATPGTGAGSAVGASFSSGTFGTITFTLNDTDSFAGGSDIEIRIGTNATFGTTGDEQIINPSTVGSYDMLFETQNAASATLDDRGTVIAIVERVGLSGEDAGPPPTGGGRRGTPTPTPNFGNITFWPTDLLLMTVQEFSDATIPEVSQVLSMTAPELSNVLLAQYPALNSVTGQAFASAIGVPSGQLYNTLLSQYPGLSAISPAQFSVLSASGIASAAGITVADLYIAMGVDMQDLGTLLGVTVGSIWNFLEMDELWDFLTVPPVLAEETMDVTVTNSSGTVQLGIGGEPFTFVSETAATLGMTQIESGAWEIVTYAQASDAGGQTSLSVQVLSLDSDGNETLMFNHNITNDLSSTATQYVTYTTQPVFTFNPGDRVIIRYFTSTSGSSGPVDVTVYYDGTLRDSHIKTPPSVIPTPCFRIADFTFECLVNLPDLSIMMYNWPVVRNQPLTDLNSDGTVGIIDFSILLFWWTG